MTDAPERIWAVTEPDDISANILGGVYAQQVPDGMVGTPTQYIRADLLTAHIGAALEKAATHARNKWRDWKESELGDCEVECDVTACANIADGIMTLHPDAMQALDRVRREARVEGMRAALKACDPTSYRAHHASVRKRCQKAIRALIAAEERGEGE